MQVGRNLRAGKPWTLGAAALMLVMAAWLGMPLAASADVPIGARGSGAGQVSGPLGVAVDRSEHLLYVADAGNNRIDVFNADMGAFVRAFGWGVATGAAELQSCTLSCQKGIGGGGAGQLQGLKGIAVDNDPASPAFHAVYVFEDTIVSGNINRRVQRFTPGGTFVWMVGGNVDKTTNANLCTAASGDVCGTGNSGDAEGQFNGINGGVVAVGPGGVIYVADQIGSSSTRKTRVQRYEPSGAYKDQLLLEVAGGAGTATSLAVDSLGNFYVGTTNLTGTGAVRKYHPDGSPYGAPYPIDPSFNIAALAVDETDHLFVSDNTGTGALGAILEYDSAGAQLRAFYGSLEHRAEGLAPYEGVNGDIFTTESVPAAETSSGVRHLAFPPPGPIVFPRPPTVTALSNVKTTLNAQINPEGKATQYFFEYISDEDFVAAGNSFGTGTEKSGEAALGGSADFKLHAASADVSGLFPETLYHFRAVAANEDGGPRAGPEGTFEMKILGDVWSTGVGLEAATLHAEANPQGIPLTGRFQYVDQATYEASGFADAKEAPGSGEDPLDFGAGEAMKELSVSIGNLEAGTTYRYRIIAGDRCKPEPAPLCEFTSAEGVFTTFLPTEAPEACPNDAFRAGAGAFLPDCRGYEMVSPLDKNGANVEAVNSSTGFPASLDQAAADGASITYSTYKAFGDVASAPYTNQYLARRGESGWTTEAISPPREGLPLMTFGTVQLERQYKAFSDDLCNAWVVQDANPVLAEGAVDGYGGLYRRENCAPGLGSYEALTTVAPPTLPPAQFIPELQGTSANGSVAIFSVTDNLTTAAPQPPNCVANTNCQARLYEFSSGATRLVCVLPNGTPNPGRCGAGSPGSFGESERGGLLNHAISADGSRIFWSSPNENGKYGKQYVRIDGTETVDISATPALFWTAAADGSKAIYNSFTNAGEMFEFNVDAKTATPIAQGVLGVAGASEDASRIYFASTKVLTGEDQNSYGRKAEAGEANLYLYEAGQGFRFIAALPSSAKVVPYAASPSFQMSRTTADGEQIAFASAGRPTGYDNTDAVSGKADLEVFLYDATANGGAGELHCVSCNPTGERPAGRLLTQKSFETVWAAARLPTWQSQLRGSRVFSDDGSRLYFDSFEALVPRDENEAEDVYQWERPGSGTCTTQRATFHADAGGCVDLISSGQSPQGSELVDISTDGANVFFKTYSSLIGQDPGLLDIYDARVGGGFKEPENPPPPCEPASCQNPPPPPAEDITPRSAVPGPGNPTFKTCPSGTRLVKRGGRLRCVPKPCPKGTRRVKQKGKSRCVKIHNPKTSSHKRHTDGRAAR